MVLGCSPSSAYWRTGETNRCQVAIFEYIEVLSAFLKVAPQRDTSVKALITSISRNNDREHLPSEARFGILDEFPILEVWPFTSAEYHPTERCPLVNTPSVYIWVGVILSGRPYTYS